MPMAQITPRNEECGSKEYDTMPHHCQIQGLRLLIATGFPFFAACPVAEAPDVQEEMSSVSSNETSEAPTTSASSGSGETTSSEDGTVSATDAQTSSEPPASTSTESGSASTGSGNCGIELDTLLGFCPLDALQDTSVTAMTATEAFSGTRAFFGLGRCGDSECFGGVGAVDIYVFPQVPEAVPDHFNDYSQPLLTFSVVTTYPTQETEVTYRSIDDGVYADAYPTAVTIVDAAVSSDFDPPLVEDQPPRVRFEIVGDGPDLEISGIVDAVYCDLANFAHPCD